MLELQSIWELCQILYFQKEQPCQITQLLDWQSKVFQRKLLFARATIYNLLTMKKTFYRLFVGVRSIQHSHFHA